MKKLSVFVCTLALCAFGCGEENGGGDGGGGTGGGGMGLCTDNPTGMCDGECVVEPPSSLDCSAACANVDTVCNSGCAGQCEGVVTGAPCVAACEGTRAQRCTNLVFGCYSENNTCDGVGTCVSMGL